MITFQEAEIRAKIIKAMGHPARLRNVPCITNFFGFVTVVIENKVKKDQTCLCR